MNINYELSSMNSRKLPFSIPSAVWERIVRIERLLSRWLGWNEDEQWTHAGLVEAINKTIEAELFSREEIECQLEAIRNQLSEGVLLAWTQKVLTNNPELSLRLTQSEFFNRIVFCLHAGNIPLSGFQDVLVIMLSGFCYRGKLSKQDPWLLASLLEEFSQSGFPVEGYSISLDALPLLPSANYLFFSGSEESLFRLQDVFQNSGLFQLDHPVKMLTRSASGSVALLIQQTLQESSQKLSPTSDDESWIHLVNATHRYTGKGCRSVSTILSDRSLKASSDHLLEAAKKEGFLSATPTPDIRYEVAYGLAKNRSQLLIGPILYCEEPGWSVRPGLVHWIYIDPALSKTEKSKKVSEYLHRYSAQIQSVFLPDDLVTIYMEVFREESILFSTESLSSAQNPPLDWKPDGVDPLEWLWIQI